MNVLWLTWKDHKHPKSGGAEVVLMELSRRLTGEGHTVTFLTCGYPGAPQKEVYDGITIIRVGTNRYMHSFQAFGYYFAKLRNRFDIVIEVVNTAPYFGVFFGKRAQRFLFYHQLAREVWFHEAKPPVSYIGYHVLEPLATRFLAAAHVPTIVISESTKQDLMRYRFSAAQIKVISEGIKFKPVAHLERIRKYDQPTLLSFGALRAMKQTKHQIEAFTQAKRYVPDLQLKVAGSADDVYGKEVLRAIEESPFTKDIAYLGRVSDEELKVLMRRSHLILQTSLKEGWGLTVSEAASQGTPAVVYDVDGLRDSVRHEESGLITSANPDALAEGVLRLLTDTATYKRLRESAWRWSKELTFDNAYKDFKGVLGL